MNDPIAVLTALTITMLSPFIMNLNTRETIMLIITYLLLINLAIYFFDVKFVVKSYYVNDLLTNNELPFVISNNKILVREDEE